MTSRAALGTMLMTGVRRRAISLPRSRVQGEFIIDSLRLALANAQSGASAARQVAAPPQMGSGIGFFRRSDQGEIGKVTNKGKVKIKGTLATSSFAQKSGNLQLGGLRIVPLMG